MYIRPLYEKYFGTVNYVATGTTTTQSTAPSTTTNNPNIINVPNSSQNVEVSYTIGTESSTNQMNENLNTGNINPYIANSNSTTNNSNFMNIE